MPSANHVRASVARRWRVPRRVRIALLLAPPLSIVVVFFLGGFAQAVAQSFGYVPFLPAGEVGFDAYRNAWADPATRASIGLTFRIAFLATGLAVLLGVGAALLIRRSGRLRRVSSAVFQSTLPVPHIVGALSMLLLLAPTGFAARLGDAAGLTDGASSFPVLIGDRFGWAIVAEYVWKETPFIGVVALSALSSGVAELEDAARTLGAGPWSRFRHVTLPVLLPGVLATSIIAFAYSFGSFEVPSLLGRAFPSTLPVVAYERYRDTDLTARPQAMAISVGIAVTIGVLVLAYLALVDRSGRHTR
ncbi:MAG: ABC transporter permease subunit [Acidimicrobiia bacterium]|jgi:putative spermidine/putrescine transport system permease protein|nr:ABC transporter permease subunit [Acidimicrobiia bacterium]